VPGGELHAKALALAVHRGRVVTHFDVSEADERMLDSAAANSSGCMGEKAVEER
jgi:hypothetical protein